MSKALNLWKRLEQSARAIQTGLERETLPETLVILGSGFKGFEKMLSNAKDLALADIPHFCVPQISGHGASLFIGQIGGREVCVLTGRVHLYEDYEAHEVVYPIRVLSTLGIQNLILTNASGSVDPSIKPGSVILISDQINLTGRNCLIGDDAQELGPIFIDMGDAFHSSWRKAVSSSCLSLPITVKEGVYAGVLGPAYETPAECHFLHKMGANVVGMSTVQEVIAARQLKLHCLGLSFVTNMSGGQDTELTHEEVLDLATQHKQHLNQLLTRAIAEAP